MVLKARKYKPEDLPAMLAIWNEVVEAGAKICPYIYEL